MQEAEDPGAPKEDTEAIKKTLRNKFNYNERQAQTMNNIIREKGVSTEPPPSDKFEYEITQWEMFDAYIADLTKVFFSFKIQIS
jgi:dynein intermediate chain 1